MLLVLFWALLIGGAFLGWRVVRALEDRPVRIEGDLELLKRVQLLEETVERQALEIQRLTEGLHFTERLLRSGKEGEPT